jgi:hypothetical protein
LLNDLNQLRRARHHVHRSVSHVPPLVQKSDVLTASKCDDISCSEVIRALRLDDEPELEEIEARIDQYAAETKECKKKKATADRLIKGSNIYFVI